MQSCWSSIDYEHCCQKIHLKLNNWPVCWIHVMFSMVNTYIPPYWSVMLTMVNTYMPSYRPVMLSMVNAYMPSYWSVMLSMVNTYMSSHWSVMLSTCLGIITFVNCASVKWATRMQNVFTAAKMVAIIMLVVTGLVRMGQGNRHFLLCFFHSSALYPILPSSHNQVCL